MAGIWDAVNNNLFNPEKPNAPGVLSDVRRASGQFASGLGSTLRDVGLEDTGGALESYGAGVVRRNPSEIQSFQDVLSRPFTTAREAVGEIVPQVGLAVGGQLAGRAIGGFLGTPLGPLGIIGGQQLGGLVGGLAPIVAQTYGGIRSEQREAGIDDRPRALGATIPAAALERFGGAERIAGKIAGQGTQFLAREAGESLWGALSRQALRGGVEETITEIPQTALERYGAYKTLTGPEAFDEYGVAGAKAFLGGGAIRAGLSAVAGTRPAQGEIDLTQPETPVPPAQAPTGLDISATAPAAQPTTTSLVSQETDLTAPADTSTAEVTAPVATTTTSAAAPTDLTAPTTEAADTTPSIFSKTDEALNELNIKPTKKSRSIYDYMVAKGIDPTSEEAEPILNALSENKFKFATDTIGAIIRARSPRGAAVSTVQQPAGSVGVGGAVVPGTLGAAGSDASLAGAVGGGAATTGAPLQQVGLLPNTAGQPSTTVTTLTRGAVTPEKVSALTDDQLKTELTNVDLSDAEYGLVKAEQTRRQEKTPIKPNTTLRLVQQEALPDQDAAVDDYVEIARATGNTGGINATLADAAGKRQDQKNFTKVELNEVIESQLADSSNKDRDRKIIQAYITARRAVPRGDRVKMQKEIGATFGVDASRVRQIGNPEKLANVAVAMGFDRNQVFTELGIQSTKEAAVDLTQANEAVGEGGIVESENQVISDTAESDVEELADDSREWQKASTAGSQMAVQLVSLADKIAELKVAADELKQFGLPEAEAAAAKRINELTERYTALTTKLTAAKKVPKPTKQPPSTEAAQKAAEEVDMFKEAAKEAEAAKFRAERAAKLAADRKGLEVGDTVVNPKLGTGVVKGFSGDGDATIVTVDFKSGQTKELSVKMAKLEKTNAVQVKSTASVPVQPKTEAGQGVGKQVRRAEKPASQGETQVLTNSEQAAQAWDKVASGYPTAPKFADLTKAQQQNFIGFGPDNWTEDDVNTELTKLAKAGLKFGRDGRVDKPYTAPKLKAEIKNFIRADILGRKLVIVDSVTDLLMSSDKNRQTVGAALMLEGAYGVATPTGQAFLIANRIKQGQGRAKFMHEVGAHLGLENLLPKAAYDKLTQQIVDWAKGDESTIESILAVRAADRVMKAETAQDQKRSEVLAYFIEEAMMAGIDPTAVKNQSGALQTWFRTLWSAFKVALTKLGFKPETLTAQDVVNLAFGAAKLELSGKKTKITADTMKFGFGGVEATGAKTFERRLELVQAQLDTANGVDPETIWKETGWYKGTDNKWRFEFDDSQAKFKQDFKDIDLYTEFKLSDVLDHPELFAQYPELKDVTFEKRKVMMDVWGSTQGWFDPKTKKLVVTPYARDPLSTVLHEVQHWIQSKEKFENGSSPQGSDLSNKAALTKLRNELQKAIDAYDASELESQARKARGERYSSNFDKFVEKNRAADLMGAVDALLANTAELAPMYSKVRALDSEVTRLETAKGVLEKKFKEENKKVNVLKRVANYAEQMKEIRFYSDKIKTISDEHYAANKELKARVVELTDGKDVAHELYRLVAGEAEARNVQSRMGMSFEERVKSFPAATMDVSPENTLTSTGRGGAYLSKERRFEGLPDKANPVLDEKPKAGNTNIDKAIRLLTRASKEKDAAAADALRAEAQKLFDSAAAKMKFGKNAADQSVVQRTIDKLPKPLQKSAREQWTNISTLAKRGLYASAITEDVIGLATKYMPSAAKYLQAQYDRQGTRLEFERRIEDILGEFEKLPENLKGVGKGSVNEYIQDSTVQKKWGYYPGEQQVGTTLFETDPDLEERFKAFPPAAQKVIKDVFNHGYEALRLKQKAAEAAVNREFEAREKAAGNDLDLLQGLAKEKAQMLRRMTRLRNVEVSEPYAYLGRYGDYVVVAKSKEFIAYEEAAKGTEARVGADSITGDAQQAKNWLQDNVSNPLHYVVQFAETQGEADSIAADLQATGQYDIQPEDAGIKEASASYAGGSDVHMAVARLRNLANRQSESTDTKLDKAISDLYLMTVAEASARRSELERKNVSGADKNMMRNLATSGRADAHFLANMEHGDAINDALETMRNQARNNRKEAMPLYNELYTRYADSMEYSQPSVLAQNMLRMSTLWHLSTSPAYYLQQALQTSVLSLPYMAGRLGYARSASAIKRAYGDMSYLVSGLGVSDRIDFDKAPADVRFMLKELVRMGKIDIGVDADATARIDDKGPLGKAMFKLQNVNARIEAINRATAAIAAYRGYVDLYKGAPGADGVKFAAEVVSNSHGNYDGFNTPRVMQSGGAKVLLQFKRFQIIQLSMLAKLIHTSFKGASAEERAIARASLKYITAHMAVLGGALGVPFVSQAASILSSVFGDEDEPDDYEYKLRRMIGDGAVADLLLRGVPAALGLESIGKRLAMENVASPFGPFVEFNLTSRADAAQMIVGMMGPSVGLGLKFVDALGMMSKGEYYKGLELALPNGIANLMKGYRFGTEGITMRNGDLVLKPEDISLIDTAFQAVGLPTTTITDRQYTQKVVAEFDKFYSQRAGEIKSSYLKASRQSDAAAMADARTSWQELQDSRAKNGYKRQPLSELLRVPAEARKRERGVVGGVETTKSNRRFVEQVSSVS